MLLEEEVSLEEPGHANAGFVRYELGRWDGEDLCTEPSVLAAKKGKWVEEDVRSISSKVNCLVSLTKKKIMAHAIKLRPA